MKTTVSNVLKLVVVALVVTMLTSLPVWAADPYKDVTRKSVDTASYDAIVYTKAHHGWTDLEKGGKVYPNSYIKRYEFITMLQNMYGDIVPVTIYDVRYANAYVSANFVCSKMVQLAKVLKCPMSWNGSPNIKMRRKDVARYIKIFANFNKALAPKR